MSLDQPNAVELADAVAGRLAVLLADRDRRLALSVEEAARAFGIHRDTFDTHVLPRIKVVKIGRRTIVPVRELERFLVQRAV